MIGRGLTLLAAASLLMGAAPARFVDVRVEVTGLRSERGVVRACLTPVSRQFPQCRADDGSYSVVVRANDADDLQFLGIPPGTYAIAIVHDENDNGKIDRALGLLPKEGFGFSRDAPVRMGPPAFGDASFPVEAAPVRQVIRMRYML